MLQCSSVETRKAALHQINSIHPLQSKHVDTNNILHGVAGGVDGEDEEDVSKANIYTF